MSNFVAQSKAGEHSVEIAANLTAAEADALALLLTRAMPKAGILFSFFGAGIPADAKNGLVAKLNAARIAARPR